MSTSLLGAPIRFSKTGDVVGGVGFSIFQIGGFTVDDQTPTVSIVIPHLLSILATNSWNGKVEGMTTLNKDQRVSYELETDRRGKTSAVNLQDA